MDNSKYDAKVRQAKDGWYVDVTKDGKVVQSHYNATKGNAEFNKKAILRAFENNDPQATLRFLAESY